MNATDERLHVLAEKELAHLLPLENRQMDIQAELERLRRRVQESSAACDTLQAREDGRKKKLAELDNAIMEIDAKLDSLRKRRAECEARRTEMTSQLTFDADRKQAERARVDAVSLQSRCEKELKEITEQLDHATDASVVEFAQVIREQDGRNWQRVLRWMTDGKGQAAAARAKLEKDRKKPGPVQEAWDTREEWLSILNTVTARAVAESARVEIDLVTAWIEDRYPGALSVPAEQADPGEVELAAFNMKGGDMQVVYLPIPDTVVSSLNAGGTGMEEQAALRVIWALSRKFPMDKYESMIVHENSGSGWILKSNLTRLTEADIRVSAPSGGSFMLLIRDMAGDYDRIRCQLEMSNAFKEKTND